MTTDAQDSQIASLLHYWFVQYNPLYFFSALCVLAGAYLLSVGLGDIGWKGAPLALTAVVEMYQLLLIAGAALLYRVAGQRRPAVILGFMELAFLLDCLFQTERLGASGQVGLVASSVWCALVCLKLLGLVWAFALQVSASVIAVPLLAAMAIAMGPHVLGCPGIDKQALHLALTWCGIGLVAWLRLVPLQVRSTQPLSLWGQRVLARATKALGIIAVGMYAIHLAAWLGQFDIGLTVQHLTSFFIIMILALRSEKSIWTNTAAATWLGLQYPSPLLTPTLVALAICLSIQGHRLKLPRLYVGTILGAYLGTLTFGWQGGMLPFPALWLSALTTLALCALSYICKLKTGYILGGVAMLPYLPRYLPRNILEWGVAITALGFIALIIGIAVNWNQREAGG